MFYILKLKAFTIVEFLTVLAIVAIFTAIAIPGYYAMIQNNKITSATNKLSSGLNLARMEAIKRGINVIVCPTGNTSHNACGDNTQWSQGWIVFLDPDNDNAIDNNADRIKIEQGLPSGAVITTVSNRVIYNSTGFVSGGIVTFSIEAQGCSGNSARVLNVSSSGRVSISSANCN